MGYTKTPSNKRFRVFFINTEEDTQGQWPSSTLILSTNVWFISDMCYIKISDGTLCLLLCSHKDRCVQAVETIGRKIRWEKGEQQIGHPLSICTDENNTVYVIAFVLSRLHILSGEDGSVIRSINLGPYGVGFPRRVRVHDKYLYVMHKVYDKGYAISKFSRQLDE